MMKRLSSSIGFAMLYVMSNLAQGAGYSLELDMSTGYNSNVFLESDDLVVNDETLGSNQTDMQTQVAITGNIEFWDKANSDASIMIDYFKETLLDNELDTTVMTLSLPMHYYQGDYRYGATFTHQAYNLSGVDVLEYFVSKVDVAKKIENDTLYVSYGFTDKTSQDSSYSDYDGSRHSGTLRYSVDYGSEKWTLQGNAFQNNYTGEGLSNVGSYIKTVYQVYRGHHVMSGGVKLKGTQYELDSLSNDQRSDRQLSFHYNHEYYLNSLMQLYFDASYIRNQSNIEYTDENYNYNQWINTLGARFVF